MTVLHLLPFEIKRAKHPRTVLINHILLFVDKQGTGFHHLNEGVG